MKIFSGIVGGSVFLILTLVLIFILGLDYKIALTLCLFSFLVCIIIINYEKIKKIKFGNASIELRKPENIQIESKQQIETNDTRKFSPIIIHNVETMSENFKDFIVEIREKGNNSSVVCKTASGIKKGFKWKMVPLVLEHTKTGLEYEIRVCVQNLNGNKSSYTKWISKKAGE